MPRRSLPRAGIFAAILAISVLVAVAYVGRAALSGGGEEQDGLGGGAPVADEPRVVFQNLAGGAGSDGYARVALSAADGSQSTRRITRLRCERVHFAADRGICLVSRQGLLQTGYQVTITGRDFKRRHELRLPGIPSRARISPDGRYGAATSFVTGHSYAEDNFSTKTVLIDMAGGRVLADLERHFTVLQDGKRIKEIDFNFWGVTFARKSGRFFATLRTGDKTYLLEADVRSRTARVLHENVECPSISPDNSRIAYKKWLGDKWRLYVLDLETMRETPLAEDRPVDDQVEWLDDDRILYGLSSDTWVVPADGSGAPRRFLSNALSPAVVRD